jgi:LuxR family maltose regulon positive regulatory protein
LWLAQGDLQSATRWAASLEQRFSPEDPFKFENELTHIARARVWIAQNRLPEAIHLLSHLEEIAHASGRKGRVIEILLLAALALQAIGDREHSLVTLTKCLTLAEAVGYARIFLDEGQPIQMLLTQWLAHANAIHLRDYAVRLLAQFKMEKHVVPATPDKPSSSSASVELLSPRELEVLHLMALGRTNQEIASELIVARGTVKAHTASIYRKLDASNRTEAVARARQLGIFP